MSMKDLKFKCGYGGYMLYEIDGKQVLVLIPPKYNVADVYIKEDKNYRFLGGFSTKDGSEIPNEDILFHALIALGIDPTTFEITDIIINK